MLQGVLAPLWLSVLKCLVLMSSSTTPTWLMELKSHLVSTERRLMFSHERLCSPLSSVCVVL